MRKMVFVLLAVLLWLSGAHAGTYVFGYTPGGGLGGGLRFDLMDGVAADLSMTAGSGASGSSYSLYGDLFWGSWGVGLLAKKTSSGDDLAFELSLQYAVEEPVNERIAVGVLFVLINYDAARGADPDLTVLPAIVPYFVLGL